MFLLRFLLLAVLAVLGYYVYKQLVKGKGNSHDNSSRPKGNQSTDA